MTDAQFMLLAANTVLSLRIAEKLVKESKKIGGMEPMLEYAISDAEKALKDTGYEWN